MTLKKKLLVRIPKGSGGSTVTVDSELSDSSVNPVQNKVIKQALDNKQPVLRSGENIKTINGQSVVGSGNIKIDGGGSSSTYSVVFKPAGVYLQADEDGYIDSPVSNEVEVDIYKDGTKTTMRSVEVISYPAGTTALWNTVTGKLDVIAAADDPADYEGTIVVKAWSTDGGSAIGETSVVGLRKGAKGTAGEKGEKGEKGDTGDATRYDVVMSPSQIRVMGDDAGFCDSPVVKKLDMKVYKDNVETGLRSVINVSAPDGVSVTDWVEDESAVKKITITADDPAEWEGDIVFNVVCTDGKVIKKTLPVVAVRQSLDLTKEHDEITVEQKAMARQNIGVKDADDHLDAASTNQVQNKVVTNAINENKATISSVDRKLVQLSDRVTNNESTAATKTDLNAEKEERIQKNASIDNDIAGLRTSLGNTYNKTEVNNIISNTPETDVIVVDIPAASQSDIAGWLDANTPSGTDPETGKSVRANKIYRVSGSDNTAYSEWAWNGTAYIMLAKKDYGIDNEPVVDSNNLISSKGVAATYGAYDENEEFIQATVDANGALVKGVKKNGTNYFPISEIDEANVKTLNNGLSVTKTEEVSEDFLELKLDKDDKILYSLDKEGTHYFPKIKTDELIVPNVDTKKPIQQVSFRGLTVFDKTTEWIGEDGYSYRIQGGCMDSNSGWIFIAGNRIVDGIQDQHNTMIVVTKNLTTFDGAKRFYGEYGHANDVAFNENTNRLYVAVGSDDNNTLGAKVAEFDFDNTEGELTFRRYIEFEDIAAQGYDVLNVEYIYDTNQYVVGSYSTGNIYDADFNLVKAGVFYYPEEVADRILDVPGTATAAQNLLYYDGCLYKIISLMQDATRLNFGLMLRFNMNGSLDGIHYITAPNTMGFELEDVIIDKKHKKIYTIWDGQRVAFMEGYLYNTVQIPPRALDYHEDLNHIQVLGTYNIQNSGICATIANFPSDLLPVKDDGTPEYHGCTVEVRPASTGGIVQFIYAFSGDYETGQFESLIFTRQNREGNWNNWKKISLI